MKDNLEKNKFLLSNWEVIVDVVTVSWTWTPIPEWISLDELEKRKFTPDWKIRVLVV